MTWLHPFMSMPGDCSMSLMGSELKRHLAGKARSQAHRKPAEIKQHVDE